MGIYPHLTYQVWYVVLGLAWYCDAASGWIPENASAKGVTYNIPSSITKRLRPPVYRPYAANDISASLSREQRYFVYFGSVGVDFVIDDNMWYISTHCL